MCAGPGTARKRIACTHRAVGYYGRLPEMSAAHAGLDFLATGAPRWVWALVVSTASAFRTRATVASRSRIQAAELRNLFSSPRLRTFGPFWFKLVASVASCGRQ